jgi:hypothetical protein
MMMKPVFEQQCRLTTYSAKIAIEARNGTLA